MKTRAFEPSDLAELYDLFQEQASQLPSWPKVSRSQFVDDLFTCSLKRDPGEHYDDAKIARVAEHEGRLTAFVSGGMTSVADAVVPERTGYVQAIIAKRPASGEVMELLREVTSHVQGFAPKRMVAGHGCLGPVFFGSAACCLPSAWSWMGQCLLDVGYQVADRSQRMQKELTGRSTLSELERPSELRLVHVKHGMNGIDPEYDFGCALVKPPYGEANTVAWCGNFYSGAFVKGSGARMLYTNWITVGDEADRGLGHGRLILRHCLVEAQARGAKTATLLTDVDNLVAQSLYRSEGYEVIDTLHSFELEDGADWALSRHDRR